MRESFSDVYKRFYNVRDCKGMYKFEKQYKSIIFKDALSFYIRYWVIFISVAFVCNKLINLLKKIRDFTHKTLV